jgi:HEAT repeat protein
MRRLRDPRGVGALAAALAWDTGAEQSYGIAAALEELGDAGAVAALVDAALDLRRPVPRRREAAEALAAFKDPRAVEATSRLAKEPGLELVTAYARFRLTGADDALAKLRELLFSGQEPAEILRFLRKCDDPRLEGLLLDALDKAPPTVRPDVVVLLRERHWPAARERVKAYALVAAQARECSDEIIDLLGELGDADAAAGLLTIVESATGARWARAARALAQTGDARGVRYFSRIRIVDADPGRRRLAEELYDVATARRAELDRAARRAGE